MTFYQLKLQIKNWSKLFFIVKQLYLFRVTKRKVEKAGSEMQRFLENYFSCRLVISLFEFYIWITFYKYLGILYNVCLEKGSDHMFVYRDWWIVYIVSQTDDPNLFQDTHCSISILLSKKYNMSFKKSYLYSFNQRFVYWMPRLILWMKLYFKDTSCTFLFQVGFSDVWWWQLRTNWQNRNGQRHEGDIF